jgi:hypothetical protein
MFRFTIRDVLWLTVVVALVVGWWIDRSHLSDTISALRTRDAELRMAELRAKELRGEVVLPASPNLQFRTLQRDGWERPRAKDE